MNNDKILNSLDMTDKINLLYLATLGKGVNANYKYTEVKPYIDYIKALIASKSEIKTIKSNHPSSNNNNNFHNSIQFFSNYQANINNVSINTSLEEEEMLDLLDRIKSADFTKNTFELTDKQYNFIFGKDSNDLILFINSLDLPVLEKLSIKDKELSYITQQIKNDTEFNNKYKVSGIYKPLRKSDKYKNNWAGWHKKTVAHGTTNKSLIQILDSGFKLSSELLNTDARLTGSGLGDAIYFGRLDQISKPMNYTDKRMPVFYVIIADIYYKDVIDTHYYKQFKYNGKNLVWAHSVGGFYRDELAVLPKQIEIKYILEITRKQR